jgi:hypothetical protein
LAFAALLAAIDWQRTKFCNFVSGLQGSLVLLDFFRPKPGRAFRAR